ncbi:hypothetical protein [Thalassospira lucentensis]|uniref:hypothetical protein n=1 Tax=Thalassospira lucentensis TaxID=168935 RepID=UPI00294338B8|nr:hypothetical protein [Thalassospira lucentensis]WOI08950.1 hypothetical protein R1T41_00545 [Thalassospira lucentensis]
MQLYGTGMLPDPYERILQNVLPSHSSSKRNNQRKKTEQQSSSDCKQFSNPVQPSISLSSMAGKIIHLFLDARCPVIEFMQENLKIIGRPGHFMHPCAIGYGHGRIRLPVSALTRLM